MGRGDSGLLVIDAQVRLMARMADAERVTANLVRLVEAARLLSIPVECTEQYPRGLGPTVPELAGRVPVPSEKLTFSCSGVPGLADRFRGAGAARILLCGLETHVCVLQTALDLASDRFRVYVAADAVASQRAVDRELALRRLERSGVILTTTEAVLFEWTETAGAAEFKAISRLATTPDEALLGRA
jgi:nicotinamidase-related amidase